ncbi:RecBCD enzyme subunit RecD [Marinomonas aquimarina]|uniref:RecBCD enzyme subunit RecD n=1 Tax=Marinomonas aquimarina TaxID=295068 RepID=A0A1A8T7F4_9GAMM|nr:exodeoxyribonuclease V subunit alpha [Marinomonas aquimarina]SBS27729.1 RecBCD enzyme subunit RecD [Marinomonas aquimarina]
MFDLMSLKSWVDGRLVRYVDYALVKWIAEEQPALSNDVLPVLMAASYSASMGQVCIDLKQWLQAPELSLGASDSEDESVQALFEALRAWADGVSIAVLVEALENSQAVAADEALIATQSTPFVLVKHKGSALLYLRRYWQAEQTIVSGIRQRLNRATSVSEEDIRELLSALFQEESGQTESDNEPDWQKVACGIAASNHFSIITGGPGTGKTTTVLKLLALLQGQRLKHHLPPLAIRLAAPTGKAAARLNESIAANLARLELPELGGIQPSDLKQIIPTQVTTLHRLLKPKPNSRQFSHNKANPLVADIVVVDEASMIDIEMMASLFDGIEPDARVILLGDKDQLASVEAGYVLGDLCRGAARGSYTSHTAAWVKDVCKQTIPSAYIEEQGTTLNQAVCMLRHSYRFVEGGVIHQLASLVNREQSGKKWPTLQNIFAQSRQESPDAPALSYLQQEQSPHAELSNDVRNLLVKGYGEYFDVVAKMPSVSAGSAAFDQWGKQVLERHVSFQLLVAMRRGEWGLEGMNHRIEQLLLKAGKLRSVAGLWYLGRPVMVTQNDYSVDLMNGDIGISLLYPVNGELKQRVIFSDGHGGVRWVLPSRLQSVETVFAMTVHKSQGSEFSHTAMLLPSQSSPILTKELIYTGITRSKQYFTLISGSQAVLEDAMHRKVERSSGLSLYID